MKQKTILNRNLSIILGMVLIVFMAFFITACGNNIESPDTQGKNNQNGGNVQGSANQGVSDGTEILGEGETEFFFTVIDEKGYKTNFTIHTDEKIVGDALQKVGLISGEAGEFGLYVKTVNGITADFDKDGSYWSFYIDNGYAMTGVDKTEIVPGARYSFKVER